MKIASMAVVVTLCCCRINKKSPGTSISISLVLTIYPPIHPPHHPPKTYIYPLPPPPRSDYIVASFAGALVHAQFSRWPTVPLCGALFFSLLYYSYYSPAAILRKSILHIIIIIIYLYVCDVDCDPKFVV